jgi:hypothetical protein
MPYTAAGIVTAPAWIVSGRGGRLLAVLAYTATSLAKLNSETTEGIGPGPVDANRQVLRFGVLPVLGFVGART